MITVRDILSMYGGNIKYMSGLKPENIEPYSSEEVYITEGMDLENFERGHSVHFSFGLSRLGVAPHVRTGLFIDRNKAKKR